MQTASALYCDFTQIPLVKDCEATDAGWPNNVFDVSMSLSAQFLFVSKLSFPVIDQKTSETRNSGYTQEFYAVGNLLVGST